MSPIAQKQESQASALHACSVLLQPYCAAVGFLCSKWGNQIFSSAPVTVFKKILSEKEL